MREAAARYIAANGAPDRLFQCAGFAVAAFVDQVRDEDIERLLKVNVAGAMHVVRAFAPAMSERRSGQIVLTASDLGYVGLFGWSVYAATKHAVVGFASSLRNELKPFGVSVQALCPPATQTPGFDKENETKPRSVRKAEEAGGVMTAEAVARAAWRRCGRGGLYIIPNRTSRLLFALSRFRPISRIRLSVRRGRASRVEALDDELRCIASRLTFLPGRVMCNVFFG